MKRISYLCVYVFFLFPFTIQASSCDGGVLVITNHTGMDAVLTTLGGSQIAPFQNIPGGNILNFNVGQTIPANTSVRLTVMTSKGSRGDVSGLMTFQLGGIGNVYLDYSFSTNDIFGLSPCIADVKTLRDDALSQVVMTSATNNSIRPPSINFDIYQIYVG